MENNKLKGYAVTAFIKPKPKDTVRFNGKSFKGLVLASSPNKAKEMVTEILIKSFEGSSVDVNSEVITFRECKLHNDFIIQEPQES